MGRYSLLAIDRKSNSERIVKFYNEEKGKDFNTASLAEIDLFTSTFDGELSFSNYLCNRGDNTYDNERYCITTTYDGCEYYFKVIFNSELICRIAKKVNAGYISVDDDYRAIVNSFYSNIYERKFQESIENTNYIKNNLKNKILKYIEISSKEKNHSDELTEQNQLKFEIKEEFKRYKTFRGLYLFMEKYKKYGYVEKPTYSYNNDKQDNEDQRNDRAQGSQVVGSPKESVQFISSADDYNQEYDEFLSDEEYQDAYGEGNATQYIKGARHD